MTAWDKPGLGKPGSNKPRSRAPGSDTLGPGKPGALVARPGCEVGYGKPPEDTRFRKGQSGNPRGRPKGAKNKLPALNEERMKTIILQEAYRTITVRDGLRNITVPIAQAVLRSLAVNAVKGQHRSQRLFAELLSAVETSNKALHDTWFSTALDYKIAWDEELQRRDRAGITHLPPPLPHPDQIRFDMNRGTVIVRGPKTRDEKVVFDQAYGELRRQVILREICRDALATEEDPEERADLAHSIDLANTTLARYRTVLPEDLYPVEIDAKLRAEMRELVKTWPPFLAADIAADGGLDNEVENSGGQEA